MPALPTKSSGDSKNASTAPETPTTPDQTTQRRIAISVACGCAMLALLGLALGNSFTATATLIIALATLQGLWRGGAEIIGLLGAMIVAVLIGPALGRALEGPVASMTGADGMMGRFAGVAAGVILALVITSLLLGSVAKRTLRRLDWWRTNDRLLGAGVGMLTGSFAAMLLAWALLALGPIARAQLAQAQRDEVMLGEPAAPSPVSEWVAGVASQVERSAIGSVAATANPLDEAEIFTLADDFVAVSSNREAMNNLRDSDAVRDIETLPSLQTAIERLRDETDLVDRIEVDGFTTRLVLDAMSSPEVLHILDETQVLDQLQPHIPDLKRALRDARAVADEYRRR